MAGTSRVAGQRAPRGPGAACRDAAGRSAEAELDEPGAGPVTGAERSLGHGGRAAPEERFSKRDRSASSRGAKVEGGCTCPGLAQSWL